jgi:glycosyltransferase involved in cell wall biosynthesis
MKIVLVSEHASPLATLGGVDAGGQNVHVAALACALGAAGHEVVVYTRRDDPALPARVPFAPRVTVEHVPAGPACAIPKDGLFRFMPEFADHLAWRWRASPPAVVHSHFWMSGWAARRAADPLGIPVVHTFHALGVTKRRHQGVKDTSPEVRCDVEAELARTCHIVATSSEEVFELVRMGADTDAVSLVPCGVDIGHFAPHGAGAEPRGDGVLVVSRLVERKGIGNVIEAVAALPGVRMRIAGGPPRAELHDDREARRLSALVRALDVRDRVELLGRVGRPDLPALYRSAAVVACVPWYEPFGLVALEAMACGRPVVASAVGGLVDTVIDGVTGVHVPPRDPAALACALGNLLGEPRRAGALGRAGERRARSRYGWRTVARDTLHAYDAARRTGTVRRRRVG